MFQLEGFFARGSSDHQGGEMPTGKLQAVDNLSWAISNQPLANLYRYINISAAIQNTPRVLIEGTPLKL